MPKLQKFLRSSFGYAAITSAAVSVSLLPMLLRAALPHATPRIHGDPLALLFIAMRELLLVMPAIGAVVLGMAWWTLRSGAPSARRWAIAASISLLVLSSPFCAADVAILRYSPAAILEFSAMLILFVALAVLGIGGMAVFTKRDAAPAGESNRLQEHANRAGGVLAPTL